MQRVLHAIAVQTLEAEPLLRRDCTCPARELARGNLGEESGVNPAGKVTEKIDKLTVFGGLEGVLKDVVRIQVPGA